MRAMPILADSRRPGICRSCSAALEWATHVATKRPMPFNAPIVLLPTDPLDEAIGVAQIDMEATTSHFATCPQARRWRRR